MNSAGAVGFFYIDTTLLATGVHTISWNVFDNANNGDGIGSRYFNVFNSNGASVAWPEEPIEARTIAASKKRSPPVEIEELGMVELPLGAIRGYLLANGEHRSLPIGSSLKRGVFYWQPGPGFLGEYNLVFESSDGAEVPVRVKIVPKRFSR